MSHVFDQGIPYKMGEIFSGLIVENKDNGMTVGVEEIVLNERDERQPDLNKTPKSSVPNHTKDGHHISTDPIKQAAASGHSLESPSTNTPTNTSNSIGTIFPSRADEKMSDGVEIEADVMIKIVEDVVEAMVEEIMEEIEVADIEKLTIANTNTGPTMENFHTNEVEKDTMVVKTVAVRPVRPTLANGRSNSFFDVREGDSTPRRWRRKMDRNAMANPGASIYVPNNY